MRIQLSGLRHGPQAFKNKCSASEYLDDRESFPGDILISAALSQEGNSLRLGLEIELPGHFICDRCGDSFDLKHSCRGEFFFVFEEVDEKMSDPEVAVIPKDAVALDISQEIRDLVILSLPTKILCRDDCLGLCPRCGVNLNAKTCSCRRAVVDPRWEELNRLKNRDEGK